MAFHPRILGAVGATLAIFLAIQFGALALVAPFDAADYQAVEDPDDPTNSAIYLLVIVVATALMLGAFRFDAQRLVRGLIIAVSAMLAWFVFSVLVPPVLSVGSVNVLALALAVAVGIALLVYPEWWVIDGAGILMGAGAAGLFGISFGLFPALVFLLALAIYDAISVYKTKHMLSLAEGVMDLKIPVVLVIPTTLSYSYRTSEDATKVLEGASEDTPSTGTGPPPKPSDEDANRGEESTQSRSSEPEIERDALFIGLGDAVIPTILVASAAVFLDAGTLDVPGLALTVPALGAIVGTTAGLLTLLWMVLNGRPHAGLPLLNGGAIAGYIIGALASGVPLSVALGVS